ncbi:3bfbf0cb-2ea7-4c18-931f-236460dde96c [Thermothielavioides terrestris]|uniref:3bfbf0cb-2ea7-4c18-931f-236460dde96c n=1 Tax=Thermothielavioides terrestris TaxID=2587410 RepID=A0A446BVA2_9PEZI|nr:3bfbf0cb-2ea7-4c18-931f-236460dde96c [Thermothielavioides terrestris]
MATQTRAIRLTGRADGVELGPPAHEPSTQASALPPISRRKQAAVLCSAFVAIALTIGYNQCFGVFQEFYLSSGQDVLVPSPASQASPPTALLAFVGTLCYGLTWAGGILVNPVISRIEHGIWAPTTPSTRLWRRRFLRLLTPRTITVSGVLIMSAALTLASFSRTVWQLLLTQGLLLGVGMSLLYFPLMAPAPEYFTNHRATAMGFILAGGGAGGLLLSPALRALLSSVGGRWTLRIYTLFNLLAGLPVAWAVPRSRFASSPALGAAAAAAAADDHPALSSPPPPRPSTHISLALAARPTFLLSAAAAFLQAAGAALPLSFIPAYSVALGLGAATGANLLAASNAANAAARVLAGYAGDRLGRQNTLVLTLLAAGASVLACWLTSALAKGGGGARGPWLAFVALYSCSAGGYYALFPALVADVFGIRQYAAVNAFILFVRGLGTMFGSPVGGRLLGGADEGPRAYASIAYWDGALLMGAASIEMAVLNTVANIASAVFGSLAPFHLLLYSTLLGTELYQTFVNTKVCYVTLPRSAFTTLQKRIFPIYFRSQSKRADWVPFAVAGVTALLNCLVYGPRTQKAMVDCIHQETRDALLGQQDDHNHGGSGPSADMQRLRKVFSRNHAMSIHLNLISIGAMVVYGWRLASRLAVAEA